MATLIYPLKESIRGKKGSPYIPRLKLVGFTGYWVIQFRIVLAHVTDSPLSDIPGHREISLEMTGIGDYIVTK